MRIPIIISLVIACAVLPAPAGAQPSRCLPADSVAAAVRPFVDRGTCAIAVARGDLDRDGRADYVLVTEPLEEPRDAEAMGRPRSLRILTSDSAGRLRLAARSERAVLASGEGGIWGDPFEGVEVEPGSFTVDHYGGSAWRWRMDFTFAYSRRDRAWQLVRAVELSYHNVDPEPTMKRHVYTPPRSYGKIDLRDFDPARYRGRGPR